MNDVINNMFDSYSDNDELKEFDAFFIGDGSHSLMKRKKKTNTNSQLTGVASVEDLKSKRKSTYNDQLKDDLKEFIPKISVELSVEDYFCKIKKEIFEVFGFLELKSKRLSGRPFRESDLLVSSDDKYLLAYLQSNDVVDFGVYNAIAQLKALSEMGFQEVRFSQTDCCPLCEAYDGLIYTTDDALSIVASGKYLIHENCICKFVPVIRKRSEYKGLVTIDIPDVFIGDTKVINLPIEYKDDLYDLIPMLGYDVVKFAPYKEHSSSFNEETDGGLITLEGSTLHVCSDYLRNYSLLDYLTFWLSADATDKVESATVEEKILAGDVYYLNGHKVVEVEGCYFDIETKERLE